MNEGQSSPTKEKTIIERLDQAKKGCSEIISTLDNFNNIFDRIDSSPRDNRKISDKLNKSEKSFVEMTITEKICDISDTIRQISMQASDLSRDLSSLV